MPRRGRDTTIHEYRGGRTLTLGLYFRAKEKNMENPSDSVQIGDLAYWPEGHCFCIFYGPTPISSPGRIKPASRVEIIGRLLGDPKELKKVAGEDKIMIEKLL
jgi:hypothetical protein